MSESSPPAHTPPPERYFSILGFIIVRKADLLAATAFLLALASTLYQLFGFLSGAQVHIFAPDSVAIFFDKYGDNSTVTRFAGQVTFTNNGQTGRNAAIRAAFVDVTVANRHFRQMWHAFGQIKRDRDALAFEPIADAYPLEVPGGGTISEMTAFAPEDRDCRNCQVHSNYINDTDFVKLLEKSQGGTIRLSFAARTFQHSKLAPSVCEIRITQNLTKVLTENDWYIAHCRPLHDQ